MLLMNVVEGGAAGIGVRFRRKIFISPTPESVTTSYQCSFFFIQGNHSKPNIHKH